MADPARGHSRGRPPELPGDLSSQEEEEEEGDSDAGASSLGSYSSASSDT